MCVFFMASLKCQVEVSLRGPKDRLLRPPRRILSEQTRRTL